MQKLKMSFFHLLESLFTCFLKDKTLHNHWDYAGFTVPYYNIPSNNRELQQIPVLRMGKDYYNIPSNNRELQQNPPVWVTPVNYNIPSNNRELQRYFPQQGQGTIITYQVITGNYSLSGICVSPIGIITYQVITGNYSSWRRNPESENIITYQVITGNYSVDSVQT